MRRGMYMRGKAAWWAVLGVVAAAGAVGGYLWTQREPGPPPGPPEEVRLAASLAFPGSSLIQLALARKYFEAEGVKVAVERYPTGKASLDAVIEGKADFATAADIPFMFAVLGKAPVVVLANMANSGGEYGIVARADRGIDAPAALKGKRVAITPGTSGHYYLDSLLVRHRVASSEVKIVNLPPDRMASAIGKGEVDAVATWEPYLSAVKEAAGAGARVFSAEGIYDSPWLLLATRETAARRPEAMKRFLRALRRAQQYYLAEPGPARAAIAAARKEDPARLAEVLKFFRFDVRLGQSLLGSLEDEARWAIRNKLVEAAAVPNFLEHVHLDGVLAVNPDGVTIIR